MNHNKSTILFVAHGFLLKSCLVLIALMLGFLLLTSHASAQSSSKVNYVALGDSVAAGVGLPGFGLSLEDKQCGRTASAYPDYLAGYLGTSVTNLACSGAHVNEGFRAEPEDNSVLGAQLDRAFSNGKPDLVSVTAGANDMRWHRYVLYCATLDRRDCGTRTENFSMQVLRADLAFEMQQLLSRIYRLSGGDPPKVLITGYYSPFSTSLNCNETRGLSAQDKAWLNYQAERLNRTLNNAAASYSFATFVPLDFSGHELCRVQSWVQGRDDAAPFHPTAEGQQAIAMDSLNALGR